MTKIFGTIPAGGEGSRWGGYFKELLPIGNRKWLIDYTIYAMSYGGANTIQIVSSKEKISAHVNHLIPNNSNNIFFSIQRFKNDIWSAMWESLPYCQDINFFAMPDTLYSQTAFYKDFSGADFWLGTHITKTPERFGVILNDKVANKQKLPEGEYLAWGTLVWSKQVADYWYRNYIKDYTDAINKAMQIFGYKTFDLEYYVDFASWKDYQNFVKNV